MRTTAWMLVTAAACGSGSSTPPAAPPAEPPRLITGTVAVDGGRLYFEELGRGDDAIVLIHGGFGDRRMWNDHFEHLAIEHRVIRYDHRGFGKSSPADAAYSPVADLVKLLDDRQVARAHLIGNSMGGTLAIDFALLQPDRVASLTVVASGPSGVALPPEDVASIGEAFAVAADRGVDAAIELWLAHPLIAESIKHPVHGALLRTMITDNRSMFAIKHWPGELMQPPAIYRLGEIRAPTLIVIGDRDWPSMQRVGELAAAGIPGATKVVIRGGDHLPHLADPMAFHAALRAFAPLAPR